MARVKARDNLWIKRSCEHCGDPAVFLREVLGPRGGRRVEDTCIWCGESEARRKFYADKKEKAA